MTPEAAAGSLVMQVPRPIAKRRLGITARPWTLMDTTSQRPGFALTPAKIWAAYRQAETNNPTMQCDLFEDTLENDGAARGQWFSRNAGVSLRPWSLRPGGKSEKDIACAEELDAQLRKTNMLELLWHMQESIYYGWSAANVAWGLVTGSDPVALPEAGLGIVAPTWFLPAPHRRFLIDQYSDVLRWRSEANPYPGDELAPGEWIEIRRPGRKIARAGIGRTVTWWLYFKRMAVADWIVFAEKFGIPYTLGFYQERASEQSRRVLEEALESIGEDGQAVLSEATKIVVESAAMRSGDVSSLHPQIAALCDAEIAKIITGATLNVSSGGPGSFALGKVHEGRATQLQFADAYFIQETFDRQLCAPFVAYNPKFAGAKPPRLSIRVQPEMDPQTQVSVYANLQGMGVEIEGEQMYEQFGLRRPAAGDALKPINVAPPKPSVEQPEPPKSPGKQPAAKPGK